MERCIYLSVLFLTFGIEAIAATPGLDTIVSFRSENSLYKISLQGIATSKEINREAQFQKGSAPSLKLAVDAVSEKGKDFTVEFHPVPASVLSKYKALSFWLYLPAEQASKTSYVERMRIFINTRNTYGSGDLIIPGPHLKPGWNLIRYDFGANINALTELQYFRVSMTMNQYFRMGDIYFGPVVLEKMDAPDGNNFEVLEQTIRNDSLSWSRRYQAVEKLCVYHKEAIPILLYACRDDITLVRNLAKESLKAMDSHSLPELKAALNHPSSLIRQLDLEILSELGEQIVGHETLTDIQQALLDRNFYVRHTALQTLQKWGITNREIISYLISHLKGTNANEMRLIATQILSEMSILPGLYEAAQAAVPELRGLVQNPNDNLNLRLHALNAVWKLNEDSVPLNAWLLPLQAAPGEGHRHLYNKAMASLEKAGVKAIPLLCEALKSNDPEVVTRSAMVITAMGAAAKDAVPQLSECLQSKQWYVRWQAAKALESIGMKPGLPNPAENRLVTNPTKPSPLAKVTVREASNGVVTIGNGIIELTFEKNGREDGPLTLHRKRDGRNLILGYGYVSWLCNKPLGAERQFKVSTDDSGADISIFRPSDEKAVVDFDIHYVIRPGISGFYTYITIRKKPEKADMLISFFDYNHRSKGGIFTNIALHDKFQGPIFSNSNYSEDELKQVKDIFQSAYRLPDGELNAKHEWENHEYISNVSGAYGKNIGVWTIHPSWEYFGAAFPNCIKMSISNAYFISCLDNKYYFRGGCVVTGDFEKIYGPFFTYLNRGENGTEMWTDAKRQAEVEMAQWPYAWLGMKNYYNRTTVKGQIALTDGTSADSTWVILSNPDSTYGWQRDRGPYMFWVCTRADGSFEMPNVRFGHYTLFTNKEGVWGELKKENVEIQGKSVDLGIMTWTPDNHGKLLWQIGIPNRTSKEFRNGSNLDQWDNYHTYRPTFPNDVDFIIGKSNYQRDWSYVHPATVLGENSIKTPWKIRFNLDKIPEGNLLLTIAISSTRAAILNIAVNDIKLGEYEYTYGKTDDNAGIRTVAYGLYTTQVITIHPSVLRAGENIITLENGNQREWSYVMYDCIKLETATMPDNMNPKKH